MISFVVYEKNERKSGETTLPGRRRGIFRESADCSHEETIVRLFFK